MADNLIQQSDNTRVAPIEVATKTSYSIPYFINRNTGERVPITSTNALVQQDNRTTYLREKGKQYLQEALRIERQQKVDEELDKMESGIKLFLPSTYVGPLLRDNNKSYMDNLISGEGTGNGFGNLVIDLSLPALRYAPKYTKGVLGRYKFVNLKLATPELINQTLTDLGYYYNPKRSRFESPRIRTLWEKEGETIRQTPAVVVKPGETSEFHLNPKIIYGYNAEKRTPGDVIAAIPESGMGKEALKLIKKLPSHTVLTSDLKARSFPLVLQESSFSDRLAYYLMGETPNPSIENVKGYSTDIVLLFKSKGLGEVVPSLTTRLEGLNAFGKNFEKFKKYFGRPDENFFVYFRDMTPELVELWNKEVAPIYGHYIDPITRTSEHKMLITK